MLKQRINKHQNEITYENHYYENGTISLIIQETIPWRTFFNSVAWRMKGIILKPEGQIKFHIWLCYPGEIKIIIY